MFFLIEDDFMISNPQRDNITSTTGLQGFLYGGGFIMKLLKSEDPVVALLNLLSFFFLFF